jgi:anti-sigma B factor antagonist
MNLQTEKTNGAVVLYVKEKRLDAHNSGELKDHMLQLGENGKIHIVVDLQEVRFIDSSGLGALLSGYKNTTLRNGSFKLSSLQPQVQSMFELTRLHRVFDIYPSVQEALGNN